MNLNKNIVYLRERMGYTQRQMADRVSEEAGRTIKLSRYQAWEVGQNEPPTELLAPLCRALKHRSLHTLITSDLHKSRHQRGFQKVTK